MQIQNYKKRNISFSNKRVTTFCNSCGKFDQIAACGRVEGSQAEILYAGNEQPDLGWWVAPGNVSMFTVTLWAEVLDTGTTFANQRQLRRDCFRSECSRIWCWVERFMTDDTLDGRIKQNVLLIPRAVFLDPEA